MGTATGSRVSMIEAAHRLVRELDAVVDECGRDELQALVGGVRVLRSQLDRLSVRLTRRADELTPAAGPWSAGEELWGRSGTDGAGPNDESSPGDGDSSGDGSGEGPGGSRPPLPPPDAVEARREAQRARVCRLLPIVGDAFAEGQITAGHLDVLAGVMLRRDRALLELFCSLDATIADVAPEFDTHQLRVWCQDTFVRLAAQLGRDLAERQRRDTQLRWRTDPHSGMMHLVGHFHPELGQQLRHTIAAHMATAPSPDSLSVPGLGGPHPAMATSPGHLAAWALANLVLAPSPQRGVGVELAIIVRPDGTASYPTGDPVDPTTVSRHLCDARLRRILLDDQGLPLDVGRGRRLASHAQRLALNAMYSTCASGGCQVPFHQCEIHHLRPWEHGGGTDLLNLQPLCSAHHHHVHASAHGPPGTS